MKILMINVVCGIKSTGRICTDLAVELEKQGHEVKIAYGREDVPKQYKKYAIRIGNDLDVRLHGVKARLFDASGFGSKRVTEKFIEWMKTYDPDVIHLHNLHGYYINIEVLFKYLKNCGKKIIWTLHDCWAFTGHCVYFDYVRCNKWENICDNCPQGKEYPKRLYIDNSRKNYQYKKCLFSDIPNLTIVTPSKWLQCLVKRSYLSSYEVKVIHNGIDIEMFKPTRNNLKKNLQLENKKIVLGVAAIWDYRKGLETFIELSNELSEEYKIVLIGLEEKQIRKLPKSILAITKTNDVKELIQWYSVADVFVNPTLEDNYPTTNLEAIACGTPVLTYATGGSPESAELYGRKVACFKELVDAIMNNIDFKYADSNVRETLSVRRAINKYIEEYKS